METGAHHAFSQPGLHLTFPDGETLSLTTDYIEARACALLADPDKIPRHVQEAAAFHPCQICPQRDSGDTCHAIRPMMAVWEGFDRYASHERVRAVYRNTLDGPAVSTETTMQRALQYVAVLSLLYYCEVGRTYWRYFYGVHPLMDTDEIAVRVYLNMFWACGGDRARTQALIETFHDEITTTARCQMERLRLFCHSDSLLNALVLTEVAAQILTFDIDQLARDQIAKFERAFFA
jgi:hypothetical protein